MTFKRPASESKNMGKWSQYIHQKFDVEDVYKDNYGDYFIPTSLNQQNVRKLTAQEIRQHGYRLSEKFKNQKGTMNTQTEKNPNKAAIYLGHYQEQNPKLKQFQLANKERHPKQVKQSLQRLKKKMIPQINQAYFNKRKEQQVQVNQSRFESSYQPIIKKNDSLLLISASQQEQKDKLQESIQSLDVALANRSDEQVNLNWSLKEFKQEIIRNANKNQATLQQLINGYHQSLKHIESNILSKLQQKTKEIQKSVQRGQNTDQLSKYSRENIFLTQRISNLQGEIKQKSNQLQQKAQYIQKLKIELRKAQAGRKSAAQCQKKLQEKNQTISMQEDKIKQLEKVILQYQAKLKKAQIQKQKEIIFSKQQSQLLFSKDSFIISSNLLNLNHFVEARKFIKNKIQSFQSNIITKIELVFQKDDIFNNFGAYLQNKNFPFLLLIQTPENVVFGAFSQGYEARPFYARFEDNKTSAFLFNATKQAIFVNDRKSSVSAAQYVDSMLMFGNSEMYIKNNSLQTIKVNAGNVIGECYYNVKSRRQLTESEESEIRIKRLEIHRVYFKQK